jgi:hypothetical protein
MRQGDRRILREKAGTMRRESLGSETLRALSYDGMRLLETEERIVRELPLEVYLNGRRVINHPACAGMHVESWPWGSLSRRGFSATDGSVFPGGFRRRSGGPGPDRARPRAVPSPL